MGRGFESLLGHYMVSQADDQKKEPYRFLVCENGMLGILYNPSVAWVVSHGDHYKPRYSGASIFH